MAVHTSDRRPLTNSQRVMASQARAIAAGGARIGTVLPAATVAALDALVASGYAANRMAAMRKAIDDAHETSRKKRRRMMGGE